MKRSVLRNSLVTAFSALLVAILIAGASAQGPQPWAKEKLQKSTRHQEWVKVKHDDREVNCFVVYPEVKDKAPAVIVIHEIFGLTDWVEDLTDQLAEAGYIAIAPDLLWGKGPNGEGTEAIVSSKGNVGQAIQSLPKPQITADLDAVAKYVSALPSCNGKYSVCGFCWGGGEAFRYATNNKDLKAAFSFYGPPPTGEADVERINCPVYGFYGGNDNRINAAIPAATTLMQKTGKTYEPVTYEGAGHGFMRGGEDPAGRESDKKARDEAWARWKELLKKI
jgi:carboxymethylenebutenolidase